MDKLFLSSDRSDNGIDMVRTVTNGRYVYSRNYMPFMPELRYIRYMEIGEIKQIMRNDLEQNQLNAFQQSLFEDRPAEFLYDIEKDLWESKNLVHDPDMQPLLKDMRAALKHNILSSRDVMFLPEYAFERISENTTLYEFRQDVGKYPLDEIYAAASLAGKRSAKIAAQQIKLLRSSNEIVRYWAALGLRAQSKEVLLPYKVELANAMKDSYPPVIITASAISYDISGDQTAVENLKRYCVDVNRSLALLTINYLLYVHDPKPFIDTIKKANDQERLDYNVSAACKDFLGKLGLLPNTFEYR